MSDEKSNEQAAPATGKHDPIRRMFLAALGSTAGAIACVGAATAAEAKDKKDESEKVFNAYDRTQVFDKNEMGGEPWVATQTGNFDLKVPEENRLARLKMTNNLVGERTYIPMLIRLMLGREHEPGGPLLGAAGMFTWQLQVPNPADFPDVPAGTILMRSMFTSRYLDPDTMEPVEYLKNPYNGKMMKLEDNIFVENFLLFPKGGTRFIEEPQFANDDVDTEKVFQMKKWGDELVLFQGGVYSEPGEHQPRFTENMWASPYDDVMNPDASLVDTRYTFTGVNKAWEKPWAGYSHEDKDLLIDLAYGKKIHRAEDLPDFHKRVIVEKYPDRL